MHVCSFRLIAAAALTFFVPLGQARPDPVVPAIESDTFQIAERGEPDTATDENAARFSDASVNFLETPLPSALLLLALGLAVARRAAGSDRRRIEDRAES